MKKLLMALALAGAFILPTTQASASTDNHPFVGSAIDPHAAETMGKGNEPPPEKNPKDPGCKANPNHPMCPGPHSRPDRPVPVFAPVSPMCDDGCGGGGGGGGCDSGCGDKPDRPGHGYGDKNHDHTGPPGQDGKGNCNDDCYSGW
jgi:hypothetical protein